jgi:hypothetical protein
MALAGILLIPGLATLWTAWEKFMAPFPPAPLPLTLTGAGALAVNLSCAFLLMRFRSHSGSLTRAAFLSPETMPRKRRHHHRRVCNRYTLSGWPDRLLGWASRR